jgi:phenylpropionate dioxygenase-like ring-hydroxylating dioxygenase large terminal subunit
MGWNLGDRIACWYHGVEVAGNGEVKDVPAVDKCPLVGQQCVRSYNVQEAHGAIFLWFGVTADQQPDELTSRKSWPIATNTATSSAPPRGNATTSTRWKT